MLGGLNQHALPHQAGGVAYLGYIASGGGNLKIVQIGAAKDDARAARRGQKAQMHRRARVQTYPAELQGRGNRLFQVRGTQVRWIGQNTYFHGEENRVQPLD